MRSIKEYRKIIAIQFLKKPIIYFQKDICGQKDQMFYTDQVEN